MSEHEAETQEPTLPDKRVTMRDVAEYVTAQVKSAKSELLQSQEASAKSLRQEWRWVLAGIVAQYQLHLDLSTIAFAACAYVAWTRYVPPFWRHLPPLRIFRR